MYVYITDCVWCDHRYLRLEKLAQKAIFDPVDAYTGSSKQKKRDDIAQLFKTEVRLRVSLMILSVYY